MFLTRVRFSHVCSRTPAAGPAAQTQVHSPPAFIILIYNEPVSISLSSVSRETEDQDLNIQCDGFEESLTEDEEEMEKLFGGIDMSSHEQVFTSVLTKVTTPVTDQKGEESAA